MKTHRLTRTALVLVAAGVLSLASAPIASAHDTSDAIYTCGGRCGYGGVTNNHTRVYACDTKSDGVGFSTNYRLRNGASGSISDANGSSPGCSGAYVGTSSNPIVQFGVCRKNGVCNPQRAA